MRLMIVAALLCLPGVAHAQMSKAKCDQLAAALAPFSAATDKLRETMTTIDLNRMTATAPANVRRAAGPADDARVKLVIALNDYGGLVEELTKQLRACGR